MSPIILQNEIKQTPEKFSCCQCNRTFAYKYNLTKHKKSKHPDGKVQTEKKPETFMCPGCNLKFTSSKLICEHFKCGHGIDIEVEKLQFSCTEDFETWKSNQEKCSFTSFIKQRGSKVKAGKNVQYFHCNRPTLFSSKSKTVGNLKPTNSSILNTCPARIKAEYRPDGGVDVEFCRTHVGHKIHQINLTGTENLQPTIPADSNISLHTISVEVISEDSPAAQSRINQDPKNDQEISQTFNINPSQNVLNKNCENNVQFDLGGDICIFVDGQRPLYGQPLELDNAILDITIKKMKSLNELKDQFKTELNAMLDAVASKEELKMFKQLVSSFYSNLNEMRSKDTSRSD